MARLAALAALGEPVAPTPWETCSSSPTRLEKCRLLEDHGIYGGHLLNGTVIYVDIVEVFKEYFEN